MSRCRGCQSFTCGAAGASWRCWPAAVLLELAAGVGLAYVAGWSQVRAALGDFDGIWLIALVGALLISLVGYHYAYRGIFRVEGGPTLPRAQMRAVVAAGFGGFLAHGGGTLDQYALQAAGEDEDEAKARVAALGGLEHGVLAIGGCAVAIAVLVSGRGQPPMDFTLPWAVIPIPGFFIGFWAADRYGHRFRHRSGWRRKLGIFLDSIGLIRTLFTHPLRWGSALCGMAPFWAADAFATWAGLATFGFQMNAAELFVGFATGMVFTRRTGPLAGAGVLALVLPLTIWVSGAPLAVAVAGVFVYRVLALLLPMPVSLAALPTLRQMVQRPASRAAGAGGVNEPALQPAAGNRRTTDPAEPQAALPRCEHRSSIAAVTASFRQSRKDACGLPPEPGCCQHNHDKHRSRPVSGRNLSSSLIADSGWPDGSLSGRAGCRVQITRFRAWLGRSGARAGSCGHCCSRRAAAGIGPGLSARRARCTGRDRTAV